MNKGSLLILPMPAKTSELAEVKDQIGKDTEAVRAALQKEVDAFAESIGNKILGRAV